MDEDTRDVYRVIESYGKLYQVFCMHISSKEEKEHLIFTDQQWRLNHILKIAGEFFVNVDKILFLKKQYIAHQIASKLPLGSCCELCDSILNLARHHPDYDFPEIFVTVCRSCHGCQNRRFD